MNNINSIFSNEVYSKIDELGYMLIGFDASNFKYFKFAIHPNRNKNNIMENLDVYILIEKFSDIENVEDYYLQSYYLFNDTMKPYALSTKEIKAFLDFIDYMKNLNINKDEENT